LMGVPLFIDKGKNVIVGLQSRWAWHEVSLSLRLTIDARPVTQNDRPKTPQAKDAEDAADGKDPNAVALERKGAIRGVLGKTKPTGRQDKRETTHMRHRRVEAPHN
jgi:hypothetical protein